MKMIMLKIQGFLFLFDVFLFILNDTYEDNKK